MMFDKIDFYLGQIPNETFFVFVIVVLLLILLADKVKGEPMKRILYKVEAMRDNNWVIYSWHHNLENAEINADVYFKGHNNPVRIMYDGQIVYQLG